MDNVHVAIRARPFIKREKDNDAKFYWKTDTNTVQQVDSRGKHVGKPYTFDRVFVEDETTQDVYEEIAQPIVESAMDGYDGTIFAYGQTASGKTYTMQGNNMCPGIIPSTVQEIFDTIENTPDREFLLRVSYLELYNESLTDLLCDEKKQLSIRENGCDYVCNKIAKYYQLCVTPRWPLFHDFDKMLVYKLSIHLGQL
ncbi:uncharacterized protein [Diadema setosum]|uniref:uncharacterized protein n=1 Tax=Diadema setosum TaxID=31175 RepID=UPI003B3B45C8